MNVSWVPDEIPPLAVAHWPEKKNWPTTAEIRAFIDGTADSADARVAVLSGLRRWSEPASTELLVSIGSSVISVVAIAMAVGSGLTPDSLPTYIGLVMAGAVYIAVAIAALSMAMRMDDRRKMAHVWLKAIEAAIDADTRTISPRTPTWWKFRR